MEATSFLAGWLPVSLFGNIRLCVPWEFFAFKMFFHPKKNPASWTWSPEDLKQKLRRVAKAQPFDPRLAGDQGPGGLVEVQS